MLGSRSWFVIVGTVHHILDLLSQLYILQPFLFESGCCTGLDKARTSSRVWALPLISAIPSSPRSTGMLPLLPLIAVVSGGADDPARTSFTASEDALSVSSCSRGSSARSFPCPEVVERRVRRLAGLGFFRVKVTFFVLVWAMPGRECERIHSLEL